MHLNLQTWSTSGSVESQISTTSSLVDITFCWRKEKKEKEKKEHCENNTAAQNDFKMYPLGMETNAGVV